MDDPIPLDDVLIAGAPCECEFTPDPADEDWESHHYLRRCSSCEVMAWSLHCPHDGVQSKCGACGSRLPNSPDGGRR